jgi:hypothetical protein
MNMTKGSIAVMVLLLAASAAAQDKRPAAVPRSQEVAPKTAASSQTGLESKSAAAISEPAATGTKNGSRDANEIKAAPAGSVDTPELKSGPGESGPRPAVVIRRDPFRPFTLNLRPIVRRRDNLSPLERYELGQLKLVGIVWSIKTPTALIEDSSGLGYTVRVGTPIGANDGRVVKISPSAIAIEEEYVDLYGAKKKREVSMSLTVEKAE